MWMLLLCLHVNQKSDDDAAAAADDDDDDDDDKHFASWVKNSADDILKYFSYFS